MATRATHERVQLAERALRISAANFRALQEVVEQNRRDLELQFRRIAQIQAELDTIKRSALKTKVR
jgi:hypothetical protein